MERINFLIIDDHERFQFLRSIIGKKLTSVSYCSYIFNGKTDEENNGDLELEFDNNERFVLSIANDGESIQVNREKLVIPTSFSCDDYTYDWKLIELNSKPEWNILIDKKVVKIEKVIDKFKDGHKIISGIKFEFEKENFILFMNIGDEAKFQLNNTSFLEDEKDFETLFEPI